MCSSHTPSEHPAQARADLAEAQRQLEVSKELADSHALELQQLWQRLADVSEERNTAAARADAKSTELQQVYLLLFGCLNTSCNIPFMYAVEPARSDLMAILIRTAAALFPLSVIII